MAQLLVLVVFGLDLRALGELQADPLAGLGLARRVVLFPRLTGRPLDGPVLLGKGATYDIKRGSAGEERRGGNKRKKEGR